MFLGSWGVETDFLAQKINSSFNLLKDFSLVVPTLPITFAVKTDWPKTRVQIDDKIKEGSAILWQFYFYSCSIKNMYLVLLCLHNYYLSKQIFDM